MEDKEKMENKEKVNCCETCVGCEECKNCSCRNCNSCHSMHGCGGCGCGWGGHFGRHHMARKIIFILLLVAAFCFGTAWGQMHSYLRNARYYGNGYGYGMMMNWDDFGRGLNRQDVQPVVNPGNQATSNATVKVNQ